MIRALEALGRFEAELRMRAMAPAPVSSPPLTPPPDEKEQNRDLAGPPLPIERHLPRRSTRRRMAFQREGDPADLVPRADVEESEEKPSEQALSTPRKRWARVTCKVPPVDNAPPTPESLPRKRPRRKAVTAVVELPAKGHLFASPKTSADLTGAAPQAVVVAPNEDGNVEKVDKIWLIQEHVRYDPWRMLVATCLLNKTSGRAARPVYFEILRRWPTAEELSQASIPDLTEVLYPIGLFNQRAASLVRFSRQYLDLGWPIVKYRPDPFADVLTASPILDERGPLPTSLDVRVFYGAGVYASESFQIYSDFFPGKGGPEKEGMWLDKRKRAIERMRAAGKADGEGGQAVEEVGEYLSDEEGEEDGSDEWRTVRANDKELRRYLIWRWGLEGIEYDIKTGPRITRERDRRRLSRLLAGDAVDP